MGAGSQRWWTTPAKTAEVRPGKTASGFDVPVLLVAGVQVDLSGRVVYELLAERINAAMPKRILELEAEVERHRQRAVAVDATLENPPRGRRAAMLAALSTDALLDEIERRAPDLMAELQLRKERRKNREPVQMG